MRVHHLPVDFLPVGVDFVDHLPPHIDECLLARQQQGVAKARNPQPVRVAAGHRPGLGHLDGKGPAVTPPIPLAVALAADGPVESDVGRDDPIVGQRALPPGLDVFEHPVLVLVFARQRVRVQPQGRRHHVLRMVADDIGVVFEVGQHLLEVALSVQGNKALLHLVERIAGPVERRGLAQHRPTTAVEQALDNFAFGIVVGSLRVVAHVKSGEAPHPLLKGLLAWVHQPVQVERRQPFPVVYPVEHHWKFAIVHPVPSKGDLRGLSLGVLLEMPLPSQLAHIVQMGSTSQHVEHGPVD